MSPRLSNNSSPSNKNVASPPLARTPNRSLQSLVITTTTPTSMTNVRPVVASLNPHQHRPHHHARPPDWWTTWANWIRSLITAVRSRTWIICSTFTITVSRTRIRWFAVALLVDMAIISIGRARNASTSTRSSICRRIVNLSSSLTMDSTIVHSRFHLTIS